MLQWPDRKTVFEPPSSKRCNFDQHCNNNCNPTSGNRSWSGRIFGGYITYSLDWSLAINFLNLNWATIYNNRPPPYPLSKLHHILIVNCVCGIQRQSLLLCRITLFDLRWLSRVINLPRTVVVISESQIFFPIPLGHTCVGAKENGNWLFAETSKKKKKKAAQKRERANTHFSTECCRCHLFSCYLHLITTMAFPRGRGMMPPIGNTGPKIPLAAPMDRVLPKFFKVLQSCSFLGWLTALFYNIDFSACDSWGARKICRTCATATTDSLSVCTTSTFII